MSKIRKSAKDEECAVRVPGYCSFDPTTTVLAHLSGGGMARKRLDIHGAYCCDVCHRIVDGVYGGTEFTKLEVYEMFYEGVFRTQEILLNKGLIKIT